MMGFIIPQNKAKGYFFGDFFVALGQVYTGPLDFHEENMATLRETPTKN